MRAVLMSKSLRKEIKGGRMSAFIINISLSSSIIRPFTPLVQTLYLFFPLYFPFPFPFPISFLDSPLLAIK